MKPMTPTEAKRLQRDWRRRTEGRLALLLDHVQTPYNVGSITRVAAAMRVEHLYLVGEATPAPSHPSARKTGLGTERYLTWSHHPDVDEAVRALTGEGFTLVGIELTTGAAPLHEAKMPDAPCLALGHEDRGLSPACLARCHAVVYVPTLGRVGSLNVASAASIAIYEARRRAWTAGS